jgi:hypothetical protein
MGLLASINYSIGEQAMFRLLLLSRSLLTLSVQAQRVNFQPCYAYWQLTDQLRKGLKPTPQDWQRLQRTDGYKRKNMTTWDQFIQQVSLVYTPGNEERIQQEVKTSPSLQRIVRFAQEEAYLKHYIAQFEQLHVLDSAKACAN